jgi:cell division protein FtsL
MPAEMQDTATVTQDRRYVYNGEFRPSTAGYVVRPNRRGIQRHISTFSIILMLFGLGIAIVLYVNNILAVNQLAMEREQLSRRLQEIENTNKTLQAEVSKKAALERIGAVAARELGLRYATQRPIVFDVDEGKLGKLK